MKKNNILTSAIAAGAFTALLAGSAHAAVPDGNSGISKAGVVGKASMSTLFGHENSCKGHHECKGHNECKGQGGCKSGDGGCKGKNTCKGKGGCKVEGESH